MNKNTQKKNSNKKLKVAGLLLSSVMLLSSAGCTGVNLLKNSKDDAKQSYTDEYASVEQNDGANLNLYVAPSNSSAISLYSAEAQAESGYIMKTLTAVVSPDSAPNKLVDWSVAWAENKEGEGKNVSDYIVVEPTADGSATANIKCIKSFEGSTIRITVTTRVGGFSADCIATYEGIPTDIEFTYNNNLVADGSTLGLGAGATYNVNLTSVNELESSTDKYQSSFVVENIELLGTLTLDMYKVGAIPMAVEQTIDFSQLSYDIDSLLTTKISGNVLSINAVRPILSIRPFQATLFKMNGISDSGVEKRFFLTLAAMDKYMADNNYASVGFGLNDADEYHTRNNLAFRTVKSTNGAKIKITVKETVSGVTSSIFVNLTSDVSGVTINDSIVF